MPYLYFELKETDDRKEEYRSFLRQYAEALRACAEFVLRTLQLIEVSVANDGKYHHGVVFLLARHVAEEVDAMSVLAGEGCAEPCKHHLRSTFEATLGIYYIFEAKSEERALAYHVAEVHRRLKTYRKLEPTEPTGENLRKAIEDDSIAKDVLASLPPLNLPQKIKNLADGLEKPPYKSVHEEWKAVKKGAGIPAWHALFGGPRTIRELAYHLNKGFWYEFQYGDWSDTIHAGSGLKQVAAMSNDSTGKDKALRPLRHPYGLKSVCDLASVIAIELEQKLASIYLSPVGQNDLHEQYMKQVRPRMMSLSEFEIKADWY